MTRTIRIERLEEIDRAAKIFIEAVQGYRVFALYAPMGTGKTTFIKAIAEQLGVSDNINSPTFSIINEYSMQGKKKRIYHFDCYRLDQLDEAINLGFEDYLFDEDSLCFIEWPELIEPILPEETLTVRIEQEADHTRTVSIEFP